MILKIKKLHDTAVIPAYAKPGDAGLDLVATEIIEQSMHMIKYGTGLAVEIPEGYVGLLFPRSSISKTNLTLANSVGVIDSGYRGQVMCVFNKVNNPMLQSYNVGDKIAQLVVIAAPQFIVKEVFTLSDTERGEGAFGSTGK
jgi:dUTP pyrophosphatase